MTKTYEWKDECGITHKSKDSKSLWVDEVLTLHDKQSLIFLTQAGTETEIVVQELKIYE